MKVCYFIQSHKNPEQVCRLVQVIKKSSPHSQVLISHDFSSSFLDLSNLSHFSGIDLIQRSQPAERCDSSILKVYLDAIDWLFEHDSDFDWLICLSGQDYPTQPIPEIEAFLAKTEYDGFLPYWDLLSPDSPWGERGPRRYLAQYISLPKLMAPFLRRLTFLQSYTPIVVRWRSSQIGVKTNSTPFHNNFICYGGRYWTTLRKECVTFFKDYLRENPQLLKYYSRTIAPEESIIPTVIVNSKKFRLCNDMKRYVQYPEKIRNESGFRGVAQVLTVEDYPEITTGDFHFARKFDIEEDREILDLLDAKVLNPTNTATNQLGKIS